MKPGPPRAKAREDALAVFRAGLSAVRADRAVRGFLRLRGSVLRAGKERYDLRSVRRVIVVGGGKAAAWLARGVEEVLGDRISRGLIAVKDGHALPLRFIRVREAGHPEPDRRSAAAAAEILRLARSAGREDLLVCLLTGGASSLLALPVAGVALADLKTTTRILLRSGAPIDEVNSVRRRLCALAGGGLARAAFPARVLSLIVSDVLGDDPGVIASGPTAPGRGTRAQALEILRRRQILDRCPRRVVGFLSREERKGIPAERGIFRRVRNRVIADNRACLAAAARRARELGWRPFIVSSSLRGDTRAAAAAQAAWARSVIDSGRPVRPPACLISGGETTVKVTGRGKGGRNQEFALFAGCLLRGEEGVTVLSAGTDGTDGPTAAAGAIWDDAFRLEAERRGMDARSYLEKNDSYNYFFPLGALIFTGPTGTNVMDMKIVLVEKGGRKMKMPPAGGNV